MPFIERPDARVYYERSGRGPALLLIQGAGMVGNGWRPQVAALADRFDTIILDNRGIGRSTCTPGSISIAAMAEDALSVAGAEGIAQCHVAGHSMGGLIAQQIALTASERVLSLALLGSFARGRQGARLSPRIAALALRNRIGTLAMRRNAFLELVFPLSYLAHADRALLAAQLQPLFGHDLAHQPGVALSQVRCMARFDVLDRLRRLAIPTLVVSAAQDLIALPAYGRELAAAIPGARFVEIADAGHAFTIQRADEVNRLVAGHASAAIME